MDFKFVGHSLLAAERRPSAALRLKTARDLGDAALFKDGTKGSGRDAFGWTITERYFTDTFISLNFFHDFTIYTRLDLL